FPVRRAVVERVVRLRCQKRSDYLVKVLAEGVANAKPASIHENMRLVSVGDFGHNKFRKPAMNLLSTVLVVAMDLDLGQVWKTTHLPFPEGIQEIRQFQLFRYVCPRTQGNCEASTEQPLMGIITCQEHAVILEVVRILQVPLVERRDVL